MHVFVYGSLLEVDSLRSTLPSIDVGGCVPARLRGFVRTFDVEFPNDGSQGDKEYLDADGRAPARVLFCNVRPAEHYDVTGVCVPVDDEALGRLIDRERRYELLDVTGHVASLPGHEAAEGAVVSFVGRDEFTRGLGGVASRAYIDQVTRGARQWDARSPEFYHQVMASTIFPTDIADLRRVDL